MKKLLLFLILSRASSMHAMHRFTIKNDTDYELRVEKQTLQPQEAQLFCYPIDRKIDLAYPTESGPSIKGNITIDSDTTLIMVTINNRGLLSDIKITRRKSRPLIITNNVRAKLFITLRRGQYDISQKDIEFDEDQRIVINATADTNILEAWCPEYGCSSEPHLSIPLREDAIGIYLFEDNYGPTIKAEQLGFKVLDQEEEDEEEEN